MNLQVKKTWLDYSDAPNKIQEIVERNSSFATCSIWVMYPGENRNRTSIFKSAVDKALVTIPYCPIVAHYDIDTDTIGGHDVVFVNDEHGMRMVNLTEPLGVIPEGANYRWETVTESNGQEREYLVIDGILWKRSAAYDKVKRDGISGQSMEITVNDGKVVDGIFEIYDFTFTAFCILGEDVEPCFESAHMETFSLDAFKQRYEEMMEDLKNESLITATVDADGGSIFSLKGGEGKLKLEELMAKYGLTDADITFSVEGLTEEELEAKFAEIRGQRDPADGNGENDDVNADDTQDNYSAEPVADPTNTDGEGGDNANDTSEYADPAQDFSLTSGQLAHELSRVVSAVTYHDAYWDEECVRYWMEDYDSEMQRVYAWDNMDRILVAFSYTMNGDNPVVDFASRKRQKSVFQDWDEGDVSGLAFMAALIDADRELFNKRLEKATADMTELQKFHDETIAAQREERLNEVFASFADLNGNDGFEALKNDCGGLTVDEVTEKCFAIRGRNMKVNFSAAPQSVRLPVEQNVRSAVDKDEPYNGLFVKYGVNR